MADTRTTQNGKATVITTAGALDVYASITIQGIKGDHDFEIEELKDFAGFDQAWLARNAHINLSLSLKLTGASKTLAIANGVFLIPLSAITLSGFDLGWLNTTGVGGIYTGAWQYRGGSIDLSNDKVGGSEVKARKYADPTQNAAATTQAS